MEEQESVDRPLTNPMYEAVLQQIEKQEMIEIKNAVCSLG